MFLTNDFDDPLSGFNTKRYIPCLRTDDLVFKLGTKDVQARFQKATERTPGDAASLREGIGRLFSHFVKHNAKACAISLPPDFAPQPVTAATVDPILKKKIADYPYMGVNGELLVIKGGGKQHYQPAMVAEIPRAGDALNNDRLAAGAAQQQGAADGRGLDRRDPYSRPGVVDNAGSHAGTTATPPAQPRPASSGNSGTGGGRLRSIDDR